MDQALPGAAAPTRVRRSLPRPGRRTSTTGESRSPSLRSWQPVSFSESEPTNVASRSTITGQPRHVVRCLNRLLRVFGACATDTRPACSVPQRGSGRVWGWAGLVQEVSLARGRRFAERWAASRLLMASHRTVAAVGARGARTALGENGDQNAEVLGPPVGPLLPPQVCMQTKMSSTSATLLPANRVRAAG